jgi:histidine triad (HIT) family protein|uniref:HIT family protein n=1 Tax=Candidatus Planktophila sp. TaxID=2175601 RepID=UPI00404B4627
MSACIFCEIVAERIPANKIFENEDCLAFLDIFPAGKGHTLVIPKKHFMDIHDADQLTYSQVAATAKQVADLLAQRLGADGTTVMQMNREAGGQTVFHLHMHVIPRWSGDGLRKPWEPNPATAEELEVLMQQITG